MSRSSLFTDLLGIQGWGVPAGGIRIENDGRVTVRVGRRSMGHRCGGCGEGLLFSYDTQRPRRIRDFPIWGVVATWKSSLFGSTARDAAWSLGDWTGSSVMLPVSDVARWEGRSKDALYRVKKRKARAVCAAGPNTPASAGTIQHTLKKESTKYTKHSKG